MPRDGSNIYHRPAGTDGVPNYPIESSKYNAYVADVEQDLNLPRPIVAGGTGATSADGALINLSAEKAAQIVTNWDATTWMAGSYFAATTATGAAPVAGHAFAGIAYVSNATTPITDMVLEATDLTDVSDPTNIPQYIRVMTAGVWGTWAKKLATTPIPGMLGEYTFDSGITFPPGSGQVRFNNATQNSTTEVFISHLSALGLDNTGIIPFSLKSGYDFYIQDKDEPAKWKMFTATADPVLSGGDFRVTATFKSGGTNIVSGQRMLVGANTGTSATAYAVRYDTAQSLTSAQRSQARSNIDVTKKNYIINGAMMVSQENGTTAGTTSGYYPADMFTTGFSGAAVFTQAQVASPTPAGSPNRIRITMTSGLGSVTASDYALLHHRVEGLRAADLQLGVAAAKPITIQFGVKAPAGTYCIALQNNGTTRSYVATYTIAAGEANTDVVKSVTIPLDTTGTWTKDNTIGLAVIWSLYGGTTYQTPAGSWAAGNFVWATGVSTGNMVNGNNFELFDVSLTEGTVAPPFEVPDYAAELAACMRYYEKGSVGFRASSSFGIYGIPWVFKSTKRAAPAIALVNVSGIATAVYGGNVSPDIYGTGIQFTATANADAYAYGVIIAANARL